MRSSGGATTSTGRSPAPSWAWTCGAPGRNGRARRRALRPAHIDLTFVNHPEGHHGFDGLDDLPRTQEIVAATRPLLRSDPPPGTGLRGAHRVAGCSHLLRGRRSGVAGDDRGEPRRRPPHLRGGRADGGPAPLRGCLVSVRGGPARGRSRRTSAPSPRRARGGRCPGGAHRGHPGPVRRAGLRRPTGAQARRRPVGTCATPEDYAGRSLSATGVPTARTTCREVRYRQPRTDDPAGTPVWAVIRVNQNVEPLPMSLEAPTWPPCAWTTCFTIASPNPVPLEARERSVL